MELVEWRIRAHDPPLISVEALPSSSSSGGITEDKGTYTGSLLESCISRLLFTGTVVLSAVSASSSSGGITGMHAGEP